ncbi:MAG TPA: FAD-dependent monooxygenase [Acetobacteraceae bacterium]|nr:FAD-dependent monooxygenase [Acetobacteraceae bacterium]
MTRLHVLIAGGGIGGLVAALALLRRGVAVDVFEQAADPREVGAGVQLAPNGTRVLCALGLESEMTAIASMPAGKEVRLFSTGQSWKLQDLGEQAVARWGAPYWMVHRGDFHRVLREAFEARAPGKLHKGARAEGFTQDADGVTLLLTSGERVCGDALVGADGVHSRIRETLFANERAQFTGIVAWRGVVPMERVPAHMRGAVGVNWIGPHGHVVMYPLRRGELLNMVGAVERDDWRVEGWSIPGSTAECLRDLAAWHPDVHAVIRAIDIPYKWALLSRDALPRWSVGRVTLLGDACHPTLPFLAQGANMAIEDGMVLARCLERYGDDVATALRRYEQARLDRTTRIVRGAQDNAGRFHNPELADAAGAAAFVDREFAPDKVEARYNWLFEYDALSVAV